MLALTLYKRENLSFEFRSREIRVMRSRWNVADLGPHHDQFILGNGGPRRGENRWVMKGPYRSDSLSQRQSPQAP